MLSACWVESPSTYQACFFAETGESDEYGNQFELLLADKKLHTGKVQFIASKNEMVWGERKVEFDKGVVTMPNFIPFSSMISGIELSYQRDRTAAVFVALGTNETIEKELDGVAAELIEISNAPEACRDPYDMAGTAVGARRKAGINRILYAPGVATPQNLSLLIYSGIDLVDSTSADLSAQTGRVFVDGLVYEASALDSGVCACPACSSGMQDMPLWHNRFQMLAEMNRCRLAISGGRLREYVEARTSVSPWNTEFLRYLDRNHYGTIELYVPDARTRIRAATEHSLTRPDIVRYVNRFYERYTPPEMSVALLVPCSNRKPYFMSKSHRMFIDAIRASSNAGQVHLITITSPLGVVPEELETVFPAANYDIAVTGNWSHEEKKRSIEMLRHVLRSGSYSLVISHLADERDFINAALAEAGNRFVDTSEGSTRTASSLRRITESIDSVKGLHPISWEGRMKSLLSNLARFQFGNGGSDILSGARLSGRYPNLRIVRNGVQMGMLTEHRGVISLTLQGAETICNSIPDYTVEMADFKLIGNLFAAGVVSAGKSIRIGDEVIIRRDGTVMAVGVASMSAAEMMEKRKGEAVRVRHLRKEEAGG